MISGVGGGGDGGGLPYKKDGDKSRLAFGLT